MKKIIFSISLALSPVLFSAQENFKPNPIKRNTLYFDFFGQGLYNSFSFDRLYNTERAVKTSLSAGLTIIPTAELFVLGAPVSYNYLFGKKNHHLELGIGFTFMYIRLGKINSSESYVDANGSYQTSNFVGHQSQYYTYFTPKIGYRFQKPGGGIFMRVTLTPPVAGINRIEATKGGEYSSGWSYTEYFSSAAFFGYRAFPWAGASIGWTLKN